VTTSRSQP